MTEKDSPLRKFNEHVDEYLWVQLQCCEEEIAKLSSAGSVDEVSEMVAEMNSLLNQFYGDSEEMYDLYRYRMFVDPQTQKITLIQGEEIDVDVREWIECGNANSWSEDDDLENKSIDDLDEEDPDDEWYA